MSSLVTNFGFATAGIQYFFCTERNGRIQAVIALLVIVAGFYFGITNIEWCLVLLCIGLVLGVEMLNTALERVCEMLSAEFHPMVKIIKDVAAGAVLCVTIASVIVGVLVFLPYIKVLLQDL
jgi:diacylglycerol kinase